MRVSDLLEYNPWWRDEASIENDPQIISWKNSSLRWDPRIRQTFRPEDFVYSLRGSRQVGKTTLVKLEIQRVLQTAPKRNVMYYSFELENSPQDVIDVINEYLNRAKGGEQSRRFIYLDEISNVKDWQKAIKKLKDQGKLKNCTVLVTGSHSIDLRHATELMPGRRGIPANDTLDKILSPMTFGEYVPAVDKSLARELPGRFLASAEDRFSAVRGLADGKMDGALLEMSAFQNELDGHLDSYLVTGGMPAAINELLKNGFVRDSVYQIYVDSVAGGLHQAGKDASYAAQLIPNIVKSITTPVSWDSLKENSDMGSHHTVEGYVKTLSDMFILSLFYGYDSGGDRPKFDGLKKVFFQDPFFFHALNGHISKKDPYEHSIRLLDDPELKGRMVEQTVASHCVRMAFEMTRKKSGFDYRSSVFYWKSRKSQREVDFVVRDGDSLTPIEVKYQNRVRRGDLYGLIDFKKATKTDRGIVVTKNDLRIEGEAVLVPASLFLLLI